jgi:hypothetical protein
MATKVAQKRVSRPPPYILLSTERINEADGIAPEGQLPPL